MATFSPRCAGGQHGAFLEKRPTGSPTRGQRPLRRIRQERARHGRLARHRGMSPEGLVARRARHLRFRKGRGAPGHAGDSPSSATARDLSGDVSTRRGRSRAGARRARDGSRAPHARQRRGREWGAPMEDFPPDGFEKSCHEREGIFNLTVALLGEAAGRGGPEDPGARINIGSIDGLARPRWRTTATARARRGAPAHPPPGQAPGRREHHRQRDRPGPVQSKMMAYFARQPGDPRRMVEAEVPLGRIGQPRRRRTGLTSSSRPALAPISRERLSRWTAG